MFLMRQCLNAIMFFIVALTHFSIVALLIHSLLGCYCYFRQII